MGLGGGMGLGGHMGLGGGMGMGEGLGLPLMNSLGGLRGGNSWGGAGMGSFGSLHTSNFGGAAGNGFDHGGGFGQQLQQMHGPKIMMMMPTPIQRPTSMGTSWSSNTAAMNQALMNQAMDEWMMMAAMDCFGMDNMIHDHKGHSGNEVRVGEKHGKSRPQYKSPAQIGRDKSNYQQQSLYSLVCLKFLQSKFRLPSGTIDLRSGQLLL